MKIMRMQGNPETYHSAGDSVIRLAFVRRRRGRREPAPSALCQHDGGVGDRDGQRDPERHREPERPGHDRMVRMGYR